ncbi:MAG: hypothetical protein U5K75_05505 [Ahrensia sp.]|nr:hypothetical protein [Ahrensia sp.]
MGNGTAFAVLGALHGILNAGVDGSYTIVDVISDTQITIAPAWGGSTGAGKPYAINRTTSYAGTFIDARDQAAAVADRLRSLSVQGALPSLAENDARYLNASNLNAGVISQDRAAKSAH